MASMVSRQQRAKGETFSAEAEKELKKSSWFASSTEQKYENAAELFEKAANAFKVGAFGDEAGNAYTRAADLYRDKLKNMGQASKCLSNAGACYKKDNPTEAVASYRSAITLLCDNGRLTQAAKLSKEVAELFEQEIEGNETAALAVESYQQAAELFEMERANSQASTCKAKVAELLSAAMDPPDLIRAAKIYEDLGKQCLDNNLLKYNAKGYFLQAVLCHLGNGDSIAASQATQRYDSWDYTFGDSREGKFGSSLIECLENFDSEGFATACFEFDRITKLDPWKTSLLVQIKRSVESSGDDGLGDDDDVDLT